MATQVKRIQFTSPKGVFKFPKLNEPDTKFKAEGEYSVKLILKADDVSTKAFVAKLLPLYEAALANAEVEFKKLKPEARKRLGAVVSNALFTPLLDDDTEEPTGEIEFKFSSKASGVSKKTGKGWTRKPAIFDAKGTALKNAPSIWGGTVGRVSFSVVEGGYFVPGNGMAGLSLGLEAVQIIDLKTGNAQSASEHGFGQEEGGFDGSTNEFAAEETAAADGEGDF